MELVSWADLPTTPDPDATLAAGQAVASAARAVHVGADEAARTWRGLPQHLSAPGYIDPLFTSMAPVTTDAEDLLAACTRLERAVEELAEHIRTVRRRADGLSEEITGLYASAGVGLAGFGASMLLDTVRSALGGEDEVERFMRRNAELLAEAQALQAYWTAAQQDAASAILAITSGVGADLPRGGGSTGGGSAGALSSVLALESLAAAAKRGAPAVHAWLAAHPDLAERLRTAPPDAQFVGGWWTALPGTAQTALVAGIPTVVGNLDGVAYAARAAANRTVLEQEIASYEKKVAVEEVPSRIAERGGEYGATGALTSAQRARLAADEAQLADYRSILAALKPRTGGTPRSLVELDTGFEPPLAAVAVGDLDTAKHVTYAVPGMTATTKDMAGWTASAQQIFTAQTNLGVGSVAVVAWMGYKTPAAPPSDFGVLSVTDAKAGAVRLDAALSGVNAVRADDVSLNVVAHSYGTTTASLALARQDENIHSFVMVGSAGIDPTIDGAADISAAHVYAGQASDALPVLGDTQGDQWAWIGRDFSGRRNPMDDSFGATTFGTDGGSDGALTTAHDTNITGAGPANGYGYLDPGTESLYNVARATTTGVGMTGYDPSQYVRLTPTSIGLLDGVQLEALRELPVWALRQMGLPGPVLDALHPGRLW